MGRVANKVAFITGAARGQGRSHAVRLAEEGAHIIAVDVCDTLSHVAYRSATEADLAETVRLVEGCGRKIIATKVDVRDLPGMRTAVAEGVAVLGRLDIVVANAGVMPVAEWQDTTPDIWDYTIGVNLTGVWNTIMASADHLIASGGGSIILTSSAAGLKGTPFMNPYVAAKHGVVGLMRAFAAELAEHNIRVNSLHPTGVNTTMVEALPDFFADALARKPKLGGMVVNMLDVEASEPVDQSNAVLYLASDEARYVTAHTLAVDAGVSQF